MVNDVPWVAQHKDTTARLAFSICVGSDSRSVSDRGKYKTEPYAHRPDSIVRHINIAKKFMFA